MPLDPATDATRRDGTARTADGTHIAYTLLEKPGAARIALIHSLAMDRHFWRLLAERLPASCLMLDCRGHGASGKPLGPYSVEGFADDLAAVLDAVGWSTACVAGASMGGTVALAFAARHPQRTTGLGLIDTTAWYGPDAPAQWAARADKAAQDGLRAMVEFQTTRWFTDAFRAAHPDIVAASVDTFLANDVAAYGAACRMLGACDLRAALPAIAVPTAIVVGREDYATPVAMSEALHRAIAGSRLTIIEQGRHLTPLEAPDAVAAALLPILSSP